MPTFDLPAFAAPWVAIPVAGALGVLAWWLGAPIAGRLGRHYPAEGLALRSLIGLTVLATLAWLLGAFGQLGWWQLLAGALAVGRGLGRWLGGTSGSARSTGGPQERCGQHPPRWILAVALITLGLVMLATLHPPSHFDSGMYHLPLVRHYAGGSITPLESVRMPVFAVLLHTLAAVPYQLGGETAAQLTHLLTLGITFCLLVGAGERLGSRLMGWWMAALYVGQPVVLANGMQMLTDCAWPAFAAGATVLALRAWNADPARTRPLPCLLWSGVLAGAAGACKYNGLVAVLPGGVVAAGLLLKDIGLGGRAFGALLAGALLGAGPWLGFNLWHAGDPVFPFLGHWLPSPYWNAADVGGAIRALDQVGPGKGAMDLLLLPWRAVADPGAFHSGTPLSPLLVWLGMPFAAVAAVRHPAGRILAVTFGLALLGWFLSGQVLRYMTGPVLGMAVLVPMGVARFPGLALRLGFGGAKGAHLPWLMPALLLMVPMLQASHRLWDRGAPPTTTDARDAALQAGLPTLETHWRLAMEDPGARVIALFDENARYGASAQRSMEHLGDWFGPYRYRQFLTSSGRSLRDPESLAKAMDRLDLDYLYLSLTGVGRARKGFLIPDELDEHPRWDLVARDPAGILWRFSPGQ